MIGFGKRRDRKIIFYHHEHPGNMGADRGGLYFWFNA